VFTIDRNRCSRSQEYPATLNKEIKPLESNGFNGLMHAAQNGYVEVAKVLIEAGAKVESRSKHFELTPLMCAVLHGQEDMVDLLVTYNADVHAKSTEGDTILSLAAITGRKSGINNSVNISMMDKVIELVGGADWTRDDGKHIFAYCNNIPVAKRLLEYGVKIPKDVLKHADIMLDGYNTRNTQPLPEQLTMLRFFMDNGARSIKPGFCEKFYKLWNHISLCDFMLKEMEHYNTYLIAMSYTNHNQLGLFAYHAPIEEQSREEHQKLL